MSAVSTQQDRGTAMADGFVAPDWDAPLDEVAALAAVPESAQIRGMYTDTIARMCEKAGVPFPLDEKFIHFKYYPMRRHMEALVAGARVLFPNMSEREALRRLARAATPTLRSSMVGRVLHNLVGGTPRAGLSLITKAYQVSRNEGTARLTDVDDKWAIIELRNIYDFADCVHVSIFEGALSEQGYPGVVWVRRLSRTDVDLCLSLEK